MQTHSRYTDVGDITVHLFASSSEDRYGPSRAVMSINNGGAGTHFATALHLTAEQCESIAEELNEAAEFMRQAPARRVEQGQQDERDKIAGGERPDCVVPRYISECGGTL